MGKNHIAFLPPLELADLNLRRHDSQPISLTTRPHLLVLICCTLTSRPKYKMFFAFRPKEVTTSNFKEVVDGFLSKEVIISVVFIGP